MTTKGHYLTFITSKFFGLHSTAKKDLSLLLYLLIFITDSWINMSYINML